MDDRLLGSALADWLHASDAPLPDAAANVRIAVERAAASRQWGWAPRRLRVGDRHRRRAPGLRLPMVLATITLAFVSLVLVLALLVAGQLEPGRPPASAVVTEDGLHWQTEFVDVRADAFRLELGDEVYTMRDTPIRAASDREDSGEPLMRIDWVEHGNDMRLEVVATASPYGRLDHGSDGEWWVDEVRVRSVSDGDGWMRYHGPLFVTPIGQVHEGDVELALVGDEEEAVISLDGLALEVTAMPEQEWSTGAQIFGLPVPDFIVRLLEREPDPEPTNEPTRTGRTPKRVTAYHRGLLLEGKLRADGALLVVADQSGHAMSDVVDVAIGVDDSVWIARPTAVYRLGVGGQAQAKQGGPEAIEWIEPKEDGSLIVHGDGTWQLEGEAWRRLSGDTVAEPASPAIDGLTGLASDLVVEAVSSDGTIWGRTDDRDRRLLMLPSEEVDIVSAEVPDPAASAGPVTLEVNGISLDGEDIGLGVVRVTSDGTGLGLTDLRDVAVAPDGSIWVADRYHVRRVGTTAPPATGAGPQWIDRIEANHDGSLTVVGDGQWRLQEGRWQDQSAPIRGRLLRGRVDGITVLGITRDGSIWGADSKGGRLEGPYRWEVDGWVRQPNARTAADFYVLDSSIWAAREIEPGAFEPLAWFGDGAWHALDWEPLAVVGDPSVIILDSWPSAAGDAVWITAGADPDDPDHVVRYADGRWDTYRLDDLQAATGAELLASVRNELGGDVALTPTSSRSDVEVVLLGQGSATMIPPYPYGFDLHGVTEDGSLWGLGSDGSLLVMPRMATVVALDAASGA